MKRQLLLILAMNSLMSLKAQWVNDPENNSFVADCSGDDSELYTSTVPVLGDTYVQWCSFGSNGWAPCLQRLSFDGTPQWGPSGIHITTPNLDILQGLTEDGSLVSKKVIVVPK